MKQIVFTALMIVSLTFATGAMAFANGKNDPKRQPTDTTQGDQAYIAKEVRHELRCCLIRACSTGWNIG